MAAGAAFGIPGNNTAIAALNGAGTVLTCGNQLTVGNGNNSGSTFSGTIVGNGSLVKTGSGTLALTGNNTYSGGTQVNAGRLVVDGSLASPVTVNSGGTLGGTGNLTSVTVNAGGHLSPGDAPGILSLSGNLILESGAMMDFLLDTPSSSDEIYMPSADVTLNGQSFSNFNFPYGAGFGPGSYTLIDAALISGNLEGNTSGTIDGYTATLAVQNNDSLVLTVSAVPEPSTLMLLGVGTLGLLGHAWRRRKQSALQAGLASVPRRTSITP